MAAAVAAAIHFEFSEIVADNQRDVIGILWRTVGGYTFGIHHMVISCTVPLSFQ
jgi:hypothetical protein